MISPVPDSMLPCLHFNRFGAATMAVPKGIPDNLIKALGQWTSEAYQGYFCLLREQLLSVTTMLAQSVKGQQSLPVEYRVGCATVQVGRQCVRAGRDMLRTSLPRVPPSGYNYIVLQSLPLDLRSTVGRWEQGSISS